MTVLIPQFQSDTTLFASELNAALAAVYTPTASGSISARTLAVRFSERLNPLDYGARFNGTSDDTPAWLALFVQAQSLLDAGTMCIHIEIPAGVSLCATQLTLSLTATQALTVVGSGRGTTTILWTGTTAGLSISAAPSAYVRAGNFGFTLGTAATSDTYIGIAVLGLSASRPGNSITIDDVAVETSSTAVSWAAGIRLECPVGAVISRAYLHGNFDHGVGLQIVGGAAPAYAIDNKVVALNCEGWADGIGFYGSMQGFFSVNSEVLGVRRGIVWDNATNKAAGCEYFEITGGHIAGGDYGIYASSTSYAMISNVLFLHGIPSNGSYCAVRLDNVLGFSMTGCIVQGNNGVAGAEHSVWISSNDGVSQFNMISGNQFSAMGPNAAVILDGAQTQYSTVGNNFIVNAGAPVVQNGASVVNNSIFGNNYDGNGSDINAASGALVFNTPVNILPLSGNIVVKAGGGIVANTSGAGSLGGSQQDFGQAWLREIVVTHTTGPAPGTAAFTVTADQSGYPIFSALALPVFTVAGLPTGASVGAQGFATNGRKPSEAAGAGTGVPVFFDGTNWCSNCSGAVVAA